MSQYPPSPYLMPQPFPVGYAYDPYGAHLAPAKRAGMLMIIIGALAALYGTCNGVSIVALPAEQIVEQSRMFSGGQGAQWPVNWIRTLGVIFSLAFLITGIAYIAIGIPVRRASKVAITLGMVLAGIVAMFIALMMLLCALSALVMPLALLGMLVLAIPAGILILQFIWLAQARRASAKILAMQMQYQQQFWQYQQQQMHHGHGYAQPPATASGATNGTTISEG